MLFLVPIRPRALAVLMRATSPLLLFSSAPLLPRSLVDITFLARHQPLDWSVIVQRAREWRVATATWLVLSLAVDLCGLARLETRIEEGQLLLERLQPANFVFHFIGCHAVQKVEQATDRFTDGKLIGDDNPGMLLAALQPVKVQAHIVRGVESKDKQRRFSLHAASG